MSDKDQVQPLLNPATLQFESTAGIYGHWTCQICGQDMSGSAEKCTECLNSPPAGGESPVQRRPYTPSTPNIIEDVELMESGQDIDELSKDMANATRTNDATLRDMDYMKKPNATADERVIRSKPVLIAARRMIKSGMKTHEIIKYTDLEHGDLERLRREIEAEGARRKSSISGGGHRKSSDWGQEAESFGYAMVFKVGREEEKCKWVQVTEGDDEKGEEGACPTEKEFFEMKTFQMLTVLDEIARLDIAFYHSRPVPDSDDPTKTKSKYIIALIGMQEERLKAWADIRDTDLLLNPDNAITAGRKTGFPLAMKTHRSDEPVGSEGRNLSVQDWNYVYVEYEQGADESIYEHYPIDPDNPKSRLSPFDQKTRLRLIYEKMVSEQLYGGAEIPIETLVADSRHPLEACFPLHNQANLQWFEEAWLRRWNCKTLFHPPLDDIRDYFGEPIAFYFGFMEHYMRWLIPFAIISLGFGIAQVIFWSTDFPGVEVEMITLIVWGVFVVDYWKRRQNVLMVRWGMSRYADKSVDRPTFNGQWEVSPVTGEPEEQFPNSWYDIKLCFGCFGITWLILAVGGVVFGIFTLRKILRAAGDELKCNEYNDDGTCAIYDCLTGEDGATCEEGDYVKELALKWMVVCGCVNAIQIFFFNALFTSVSNSLNEWENHKTEEQYDNTLILKAFIFKFINSFGSLYYIGFVQPVFDNMGYNDEELLNVLRIQLVALFFTALVVQNSVEVMVPILVRRMGNCMNKADYSQLSEEDTAICTAAMSPAEVQFEKADYPNTLEDMAEIVVQYGYVTLFNFCFPAIPILAVINNIIEIKVDGWKLVEYSRRPMPSGASGLGTWVSVLEFFSFISVITNASLFCFRTGLVAKYFGDEDLQNTRVKVFAVSTFILLAWVGIIKICIKDEPRKVTEHLQRQRRIEDVIVKGAKVDTGLLKKCDEIDGVIRDRMKNQVICCCGLLTVTKGIYVCRCIPWFSIGKTKAREHWTQQTADDAEDAMSTEFIRSFDRLASSPEMSNIALRPIDNERKMRPHRARKFSDLGGGGLTSPKNTRGKIYRNFSDDIMSPSTYRRAVDATKRDDWLVNPKAKKAGYKTFEDDQLVADAALRRNPTPEFNDNAELQV